MVPRAAGREPEPAGDDALASQVGHCRDIARCGVLVVGAALAHHVEPQCSVGYLRGNVDVVGAGVDGIEELGERVPVPRKALVKRSARDVLDPFHQLDQLAVIGVVHRRETDAAVAHHDRRDAVP